MTCAVITVDPETNCLDDTQMKISQVWWSHLLSIYVLSCLIIASVSISQQKKVGVRMICVQFCSYLLLHSFFFFFATDPLL